MDSTALISVIFHARITQYLSVAGATLYIYDYFLTLGSEVELFWMSKGGWLIRSIVIVIRYLPMIGFPIALLSSNPFITSLSTPAYATLSIYFCRLSWVGGVYFQLACCMTTTAIFCLRVRTLYESRPRVGRFILAVFWACTAAQFTISSVSLSMLIPRIGTINGHCATTRPAAPGQTYIVAVAYIAATPCEIVIILATVYHAMNSRRVIFNTSVVWPVLHRLYTDGVFWFVIELCLRLWGCFQWLFCPPDLKNSSDRLIYALQTIIAGRFFLAFRRHIGNSTSATADVVNVSPKGKAAAGLGIGSSTFSSSFPSFRPGASDQEVITSVTSARNRQGEQSRFQSINQTTQDGRSTQPYSLTTFDEEGIQISFNLPQEYELEVLRPGPRQDESTVRNIDASHYDLEGRRTNSELRAVVSTVGVRESP